MNATVRRASLNHTCVHQDAPGGPLCGRHAVLDMREGVVSRPYCVEHATASPEEVLELGGRGIATAIVETIAHRSGGLVRPLVESGPFHSTDVVYRDTRINIGVDDGWEPDAGVHLHAGEPGQGKHASFSNLPLSVIVAAASAWLLA